MPADEKVQRVMQRLLAERDRLIAGKVALRVAILAVLNSPYAMEPEDIATLNDALAADAAAAKEEAR